MESILNKQHKIWPTFRLAELHSLAIVIPFFFAIVTIEKYNVIKVSGTSLLPNATILSLAGKTKYTAIAENSFIHTNTTNDLQGFVLSNKTIRKINIKKITVN